MPNPCSSLSSDSSSPSASPNPYSLERFPSDPTILTRSLVNQLIPSYNFLKSVLDADDKIVAALRRTTWIFLEDHTKNLVPNINHMSETGGSLGNAYSCSSRIFPKP